MRGRALALSASFLAISLNLMPLGCISAEPSPIQRFMIPAESLDAALREIGHTSGTEIMFQSKDVAGLRSPLVSGDFSVEDAVAHALAGSGLTVSKNGGTIIVGGRSGPGTTPKGSEDTLGEADIVVTGSHIKGAIPSSPVFAFNVAKLRDEGITDMRGLAAAIPQNFTGGQNPGVGNGAESRGSQNGDSTTALDLRGLGPDATLTLLDGHRMVYGLNGQSVDLSSIPLAAVDRVEIMPDGASAIYGSDAVGGVANVVLKRSFEGLVANATIGGAADGGDFDQNYSVVGGTQWHSGGVVVTGNFDRNTGLFARDRSIADSMNGGASLFPSMKSYGGLASLHQGLGPIVRLDVDTYYSHRISSSTSPYDLTDPVTVYGIQLHSKNWSGGVNPTVTVDIHPWSVSLSGEYGLSRSSIETDVSVPGTTGSSLVSRFRNEMKSVEVNAEGPLFQLPAGDVRAAIGGGYRQTSLTNQLSFSLTKGSQNNYFGFAELNIPITSPELAVPLGYRMSIDAAYRYEDYPGIGRVGTPKVGLAWWPIPDLDFKFSWGKSFKAPTLFQQLFQPVAIILPGDLFGDRVSPDGRPIVEISGGNPALRPERATSLSATFDFHPLAIPGLNLGLTYFKVNYRDRVVFPITSEVQALSDPVFANFVQFDPSEAAVQQALALSPQPPTNYTGSDFDPANVAAIIDSRYANVARERFDGFDLEGSYTRKTASAGTFSLNAGATYLRSRRAALAGEAYLQLAGTLYNPPHFKARGGLTWTGDGATGSFIVNYVGGVTDNRFGSIEHIRSMTTLDVSVKRHVGSATRGIDLQFSMLNALNAKPDLIRTGDIIDQPYDFTNYSAIGRFVSVSLTKSW